MELPAFPPDIVFQGENVLVDASERIIEYARIVSIGSPAVIKSKAYFGT